MSIETQPTILRFQDGSTDKVWVMCPNQNGENWVYWGATRWDGSETATLQGKSVSGTPFDRVYEKECKGYRQWHGVSFDLNTRRVSTRQSETSRSHASFWYRIDPAVPTADISSFLDELCQGLADYETESNTSVLVDQFNALSLTAALRAGEHSGTSEYSESPMAGLLLHSIRRAWKSLVLVSDDDNEMMPDRLDDLYDLLCNEHLFGKMPDHWMPPAFKEIAIALRCIDRPVNLANLTTEKPAAFF